MVSAFSIQYSMYSQPIGKCSLYVIGRLFYYFYYECIECHHSILSIVRHIMDKSDFAAIIKLLGMINKTTFKFRKPPSDASVWYCYYYYFMSVLSVLLTVSYERQSEPMKNIQNSNNTIITYMYRIIAHLTDFSCVQFLKSNKISIKSQRAYVTTNNVIIFFSFQKFETNYY